MARALAALGLALAPVASTAAELALRTPAGPVDARERGERPEPPPADEMRGNEAWLSAGVRYDRNLSVDIDRVDLASSPVATVDLYGYNQLLVHAVDLRTIGYVDLDFNLQDSDRDYQTVTLQTGPVLHLDEGWDLYTALAGSASFFGYELYTGFGALYLRLEDLSGSLVRGIGLDVGFEHTSNDFGGGDAPWLDLSTSLGWDALVSDLDWLEFSAVLEYYFADQPVYAYGQLEAMLGYGFTPIDRLEISCSVMGYRRVYDAPWTEGLSDRRDWLLRADVGLLYTGLFLEPLALELTGAYEQNWSNDPVQSYDGGSASIVLHWIF